MTAKMTRKTKATEPTGSDPLLSAPVRNILLRDIARAPDNARRRLEGVEDLAASMREVGLLQPVVVRDAGPTDRPHGWTLVAGHRRLAAAELLGWESIRATVLEGVDASAPAALAENLARADLSPLEEAEALAKLLDDSVGTSPAPGGGHRLEGLSLEAAAGKLGIPVRRARRRLALVGLEPKWRKAYVAGEVTLEALELLASVPADTRKRMEFWGHVSREQVAQALRQGAMDISAAPFDTESCSGCSQRIGLVPDLFDTEDQLGKAGRCGKQSCWDEKAAAAIRAKIEKARKKHPDLVVTVHEHEIEGRAPLEKLADESGARSTGAMISCQKGERGAVPVVDLVGPAAGKVTWKRAYQSSGTRQKPTTEKEREAERALGADRKAAREKSRAIFGLPAWESDPMEKWARKMLSENPGKAVALLMHAADRTLPGELEADLLDQAVETMSRHAHFLVNAWAHTNRSNPLDLAALDRLLAWLDLPKELQLPAEPAAKKARRKTTEETVEEGLRAEREANEAEGVAS